MYVNVMNSIQELKEPYGFEHGISFCVGLGYVGRLNGKLYRTSGTWNFDPKRKIKLSSANVYLIILTFPITNSRFSQEV